MCLSLSGFQTKQTQNCLIVSFVAPFSHQESKRQLQEEVVGSALVMSWNASDRFFFGMPQTVFFAPIN